jgi:hypothetical protein
MPYILLSGIPPFQRTGSAASTSGTKSSRPTTISASEGEAKRVRGEGGLDLSFQMGSRERVRGRGRRRSGLGRRSGGRQSPTMSLDPAEVGRTIINLWNLLRVFVKQRHFFG